MTKSALLSPLLLAGIALGIAPDQGLAQKRERDLITRAEILASAQKEQDLWFLIRSLRPHFLAPPRGIRSMAGGVTAPIAVYINGTRAGDLGHLRLVAAINVEEVRYLDPSKAENEFGLSHSGGAIMVKLVRAAELERKPPEP
jgi:hypothetical protein